MKSLNYRIFFLRSLIIALSISAAIGIFVFLIGDFGDTEIKLLATTLTIGGFSLTGLCCSTIYERDDLTAFSGIGMASSILGFLLTTSTIWNLIPFEDCWKGVLILVILTVAFAHTSLLLLIKPKSNGVKYGQVLTIVFVSIVALMLITTTINAFEEDELFFRLLGVFSILDVLGTITTPILNRVTESEG